MAKNNTTNDAINHNYFILKVKHMYMDILAPLPLQGKFPPFLSLPLNDTSAHLHGHFIKQNQDKDNNTSHQKA